MVVHQNDMSGGGGRDGRRIKTLANGRCRRLDSTIEGFGVSTSFITNELSTVFRRHNDR